MLGLGLGLGLRSTPQGVVAQIVASWETRVAANGGTVSPGTKAAVVAFVAAAIAAGIWNRLLRVNLFAGTGLAACLTPLLIGAGNAIETNVNFIEASYTETGGLVGASASNRYLQTGFIFTKAGAVGGVTLNGFAILPSARTVWGATDGAGFKSMRLVNTSTPGTEAHFLAGDDTIKTLITPKANGTYSCRRASSTDLKTFRNGIEQASDVTANAIEFPAYGIYLFANNASGVAGAALTGTIGGYSFDDGTIPDTDQPAWRTMWSNLNVALGRPNPA
jgi:hypothetical protein